MSNYEIAKKWITWNGGKISFNEYANITEEKWRFFKEFMFNKYGDLGDKQCQHYINKIDYIRSKL